MLSKKSQNLIGQDIVKLPSGYSLLKESVKFYFTIFPPCFRLNLIFAIFTFALLILSFFLASSPFVVILFLILICLLGFYFFLAQLFLIVNQDRGITILKAMQKAQFFSLTFLTLHWLEDVASFPRFPRRLKWRFGLISQVFAVEGLTGHQALSRSKSLIEGFYWAFAERMYFFRFFVWVILLLYFVIILILNILGLPKQLILSFAIIYIIFIAPIYHIYHFKIYQALVGIKTNNPNAREEEREKSWLLPGRFLFVIIPIILIFLFFALVFVLRLLVNIIK